MQALIETVIAQLAINGGPMGFGKMEGTVEPKIGVAEYLAIGARFGFKAEVLAHLAHILKDADLQGDGPTLSKYLTTFPSPSAGSQFEARARALFGSPFALGVSSGTGALHAAMVACGAAPGKEVVVAGLGFLATAVAAALCGATPVFCDVDSSMQLDPAALEACLSPRTVAIAPTHHWGMLADMDPILEIARRHNLKVIEDCAQSPGAMYRGRFAGTLGDFGCFSISGYKIIGGGEGGLLLARDQRLFERASQVVECGGLWRPDRFAPPRYDGELFVGTNYRMSELEAAVDLVQLDKLAAIVERYRNNYRRIAGQLESFRELAPQRINDREGYIGYQLRFFPHSLVLAARLTEALVAEGLPASTRGLDSGPDWHLCSEMYPLTAKAGLVARHENCPVAEDLYRREVTLTMNQWWSAADCDAIAAALNKVFSAFCEKDPVMPAWL